MKEGDKLRDKGIQLSLFNAEMTHFDWKSNALKCLQEYIKLNPGEKFQAEDVRQFAYKNGLPKPPSHRAWGGIMVGAKKSGIIRFVGYENVDNPKAHSTPASVWRSA